MEGPFDLLSMIRKIKNGRLTRKTMVAVEPDGEAAPAEDWPLLSEVIVDEELSRLTANDEAPPRFSAFKSLRDGADTFLNNPSMALLTGVFIACALLGVFLFSGFFSGLIFGLISAVWCYFVFNCYMISLLCKSRMQLLHLQFYRWLLFKKGRQILIASLCFSILPGIIPVLLYPLFGPLVFTLTIFPGLLFIAYFLFVPMIMVDRRVGFRSAISVNRQVMRSAGIDFYSVVFGLTALNFIIPLLPISMPVTLGAACDLYDKVYNEY